MRKPSFPSSTTKVPTKLIVYSFIAFFFVIFIFPSLKFTYPSRRNLSPSSLEPPHPIFHLSSPSPPGTNTSDETNATNVISNGNDDEKTHLRHVVFAIAASSSLWNHRKNYIKLWWRPNVTHGYVWLDELPVTQSRDDLASLPPLKVSSNISNFRYTNKNGNRWGIRISRIVSETVRLLRQTVDLDDEDNEVRWLVMGDDDTVFVVDNLVRVLGKYDHTKFYYIGSPSESHFQNIDFSYNMAYGGGGFAISYPLAKALEKMQDRCIHRYPGLYGSDDRIQACVAELGVPLTKELGFHQFDVHGSAFGLLAAHPIAPLVSLHHLDLITPIFPGVNQVHALERLKIPMKLDSAGLMQQSICYDMSQKWTISVSWGYTVQIFRGLISVREVERPGRTFLNWSRRDDWRAFSFNTRPFARTGCQMPFVYVLCNALYIHSTKRTASEYVKTQTHNQQCKWKMNDPSEIHRVEVHKDPDPHLWDQPPRRNCCRVLPTKKKGTIVIDVGVCGENEIIEPR